MTSDVDFLGLTRTADGEFGFVVHERLARIDGRLYGGTAISVSIAAAEAVTEREARWMTTQFVSTVATGEPMSVRVEVLAGGKRTQQVRVTGTSAQGAVVFASLGATGEPRPDGLTGGFETMPQVDSPEESERWASPLTGMLKAAGLDMAKVEQLGRGFEGSIQVCQPQIHGHPDQGPGRICLWVQRKDAEIITGATLAFLADMVPMSVSRALGILAGGTSLDNTIRFGPVGGTGWALLDLRPHLAVGGYAHGIAHLWSQDGKLLATASQTASMREVDMSLLAHLTGD